MGKWRWVKGPWQEAEGPCRWGEAAETGDSVREESQAWGARWWPGPVREVPGGGHLDPRTLSGGLVNRQIAGQGSLRGSVISGNVWAEKRQQGLGRHPGPERRENPLGCQPRSGQEQRAPKIGSAGDRGLPPNRAPLLPRLEGEGEQDRGHRA